jgi:hypothetical protein
VQPIKLPVDEPHPARGDRLGDDQPDSRELGSQPPEAAVEPRLVRQLREVAGQEPADAPRNRRSEQSPAAASSEAHISSPNLELAEPEAPSYVDPPLPPQTGNPHADRGRPAVRASLNGGTAAPSCGDRLRRANDLRLSRL